MFRIVLQAKGLKDKAKVIVQSQLRVKVTVWY